MLWLCACVASKIHKKTQLKQEPLSLFHKYFDLQVGSEKQQDVMLSKLSAPSVGFPLGHGYFISLSFFLSSIHCQHYLTQSYFFLSVTQCASLPQEKKPWGSLDPSNLEADVTWLPTSKGPVNCRKGEIIYLWLAFSLVNVNEFRTWLLSEPWPWPHGQYIISLQLKKHTFLFHLWLVKPNFWFADCQAYFGEIQRARSDLHKDPCSGVTWMSLNKGAVSLKCSLVFSFGDTLSLLSSRCFPFCG